MKLVVAGTRPKFVGLHEPEYRSFVRKVLTDIHNSTPITTILSGCATGPDTYGEEWANDNDIHVEYYPANWEEFGKKAGFIRNADMALACDEGVLFWNKDSKGTSNMLRCMYSRSKPVKIFFVPRR